MNYLKNLLLLTIIIFAGCSEPEAGIQIHSDPFQTDIKSEIFYFKGYEIKKLKAIDVSAKILSTKKYNLEIAPIDLALGWKKMSDQQNLKDIDISQHGRWYYWRTEKKLENISIKEIETQSSNWHVVPANDNIKERILDLDKNDLIRMKGYLISVKDSGKVIFNSSLTRNDTGAYACEVIFVETIEKF